MPVISINNFQGINTNINPLSIQDGQLIQCQNMIGTPFGALAKRPGYVFYEGLADSNPVHSLFTWYRNDGSTFFNYRFGGSVLYFSQQGTTNWSVCINGTFPGQGYMGYDILDDVMMVGNGIDPTKHSLDGTSFIDTTLAPVASKFVQYQNRIYAMGTASTLFWSAIDDATNWQTSGTSDSSSINIPGEGRLFNIIKNNNTLLLHKSARRQIYRWNGVTLVDSATNTGMTSTQAYAQSEDIGFWNNRLGIYAYNGGNPQIISNPIQNMIDGIHGNNYGTMPGEVHVYNYYLAVGDTSDAFVGNTLNNSIFKYDVRLNNWGVWTLNHKPTAFNSYIDAGLDQLFIFGADDGQCFVFRNEFNNDSGAPIEGVVEFIVKAGTLKDKNWYNVRVSCNPGCEAQVEVAVTNTLTERARKYVSLGQVVDGVLDARIPSNMARGRFMFVKVSDTTTSHSFILYGAEIDYDLVVTAHG